MFAVGLVGEYVGRIFEEVKHRPHFIRRVFMRDGEIRRAAESLSRRRAERSSPRRIHRLARRSSVAVSDLVSIVLPVHNQADHIEAVVDGLRGGARAPGLPVRIDPGQQRLPGSVPRDLSGTGPVPRQQSAINSRQGGWGLAVKLGLQHATGSWLGIPTRRGPGPINWPRCLAGAHEPRNRRQGVQAGPLGHAESWLVASTIGNAGSLFNVTWSDVNGTPKFFPRGFERLLALTRDDDLIDLEFLRVCRREGYPVLEVPIFAGKRHGGESTTRLARP